MDKRDLLRSWINESEYIVFFGGAGVSTESNIPDFRSQDGLYNTQYKYPPETILSHTFYRRRPDEFFRFYRNKMLFPDAAANKAHIALAKLEEQGKLKAVITQNIDGLHQKAGSRVVYELHGSVHRNYCESCGSFYDLKSMMRRMELSESGIPVCEKCGGRIKPDVVLYEESLDYNTMQDSIEHIKRADMLIIGGTSLVVYPAAGFINYFRGKRMVLINKSGTSVDDRADLVINDSIGEVLDSVIG